MFIIIIKMPPPMAPSRSTPKAGSSSSASKIESNPNRRQSQTPASNFQSINLNSKKPPSGSRSNSTLSSKEAEFANWRRRKTYDPMKAAAEGKKKRGTMSAVETTVDDITPTR